MQYELMERDFIVRTIALLKQYEEIRGQFDAEEQYNHTLLINCLLGIVVLPKEKHLAYIPGDRVSDKIKNEFGLKNSAIDVSVKSLRDLIIQLRHSIAHFNLECLSYPEGSKTIDYIEFTNGGRMIVRFYADELLPFITSVADRILQNLDNYKYKEESAG